MLNLPQLIPPIVSYFWF